MVCPNFLVGFFLSILSLYAGVEWAPVNRAKFDELKKGDHLDKFKFDIREVWTNYIPSKL